MFCYTLSHCYILLYTVRHCYIPLFTVTLLYTVIYCDILLYTVIYCYVLFYIVIYCHILLYTVIFCYILLHTVIYCYILLFTVYTFRAWCWSKHPQHSSVSWDLGPKSHKLQRLVDDLSRPNHPKTTHPIDNGILSGNNHGMP